jgi:hypothetical protein
MHKQPEEPLAMCERPLSLIGQDRNPGHTGVRLTLFIITHSCWNWPGSSKNHVSPFQGQQCPRIQPPPTRFYLLKTAPQHHHTGTKCQAHEAFGDSLKSHYFSPGPSPWPWTEFLGIPVVVSAHSPTRSSPHIPTCWRQTCVGEPLHLGSVLSSLTSGHGLPGLSLHEWMVSRTLEKSLGPDLFPYSKGIQISLSASWNHCPSASSCSNISQIYLPVFPWLQVQTTALGRSSWAPAFHGAWTTCQLNTENVCWEDEGVFS